MTELATAPITSPPVSFESGPETSRDITTMSNSELLEEARDFNRRYKDETYFPSKERQDFLKSIAHSIDTNTQGAIGYSLRGEKLRSVEARTFLDNVINMGREVSDPTYQRKTRGTMTRDVAEGAISDFRDFTYENALGTKVKRKTAETLAKAVNTTRYLGRTALMTTVLIAQTGVNVAVKSGKAAVEVPKFVGRHSKKAADVLMKPSTLDPSWFDFVREADAAELEALSQPSELASLSGEAHADRQEESKQKSKARKLGRTALRATLVAGTVYYLSRHNEHKAP